MSDSPLTETPAPQESVGGDPAGRPVGHDGTRVDVAERTAWSISGFLALAIGALAMLGAGALLLTAVSTDAKGASAVLLTVGMILLFVPGLLITMSTTVVSPGDTKVVQLFGKYVGTVRETGLRMLVPLATRRGVSVKVHNFETPELKVNDADGNPVNIAAIVVWQVADTAKALFAVEKYTDFVAVQAESALRHVASIHPYDNAAPGTETLRGTTDLVAGELAAEVAARVKIAGLEIVETRISSLAYAPEIAQAMLQRQQASAIIAAREKIVEGAVTMVDGALRRLEADNIVQLDDERKATMVSNLLVVLCSESRTTPVINTGGLYH